MWLLPNLIQALYKTAVKPILFTLDAELVHNLAAGRLKQLGRLESVKQFVADRLIVKDARLRVTHRTLDCPNPVGLAAGFDKGADLLPILPAFGFGFVEVGTLTPLPQEGQKKPRLFRFPKEQALINRMGFNNPGVKLAVERIKAARAAGIHVPVGVNIGKGRETPLDEAREDYLAALEHAHEVADYIVLNISSPNTPGLRDLQGARYLDSILRAVVEKNRSLDGAQGIPSRPLFVKVSPDADEDTLEEIAHMAVEQNVGLVATNTTIDHSSLHARKKMDGGLSGRPLKTRSNEVLARLRKLTKGVVPLIGVGGIFSARDAYEKIRLGATMVQIYTGWIYEGPTLASDINRGLIKLMEKDGFKRIQDAIGTSTIDA